MGLAKCFSTFFIEGKFIYFRDFSYDLGIRRSLQNAARGATTRPQKYRNFHSVTLVHMSLVLKLVHLRALSAQSVKKITFLLAD